MLHILQKNEKMKIGKRNAYLFDGFALPTTLFQRPLLLQTAAPPSMAATSFALKPLAAQTNKMHKMRLERPFFLDRKSVV